MAESKSLDEQFRWFADHVFLPTSPLYVRLAHFVASEPELLAMAAQAREGQPQPNLFFGAVQFLLLLGLKHPLADYFPSVTGHSRSLEGVEAAFRAFCFENREAILPLMQSRRVQTNEVRRCVNWLPAFQHVSALVGNEPMAMIEVGCSAGLNVNWDRYGYHYSDGRTLGDPASPVQLSCELRGDRQPPLPDRLPDTTARWGIDLNPLDITDPNEALWLQALIWPEQEDRRQALLGAIVVAKQAPPRLLAGDVFEQLPKVLALVPPDQPVCVYHSFMAYQLFPEARDRLSALFTELGRTRPIHRLAMEILDHPPATVELTVYGPTGTKHQILANCDQHGRWLEWLAEPVAN